MQIIMFTKITKFVPFLLCKVFMIDVQEKWIAAVSNFAFLIHRFRHCNLKFFVVVLLFIVKTIQIGLAGITLDKK